MMSAISYHLMTHIGLYRPIQILEKTNSKMGKNNHKNIRQLRLFLPPKGFCFKNEDSNQQKLRL